MRTSKHAQRTRRPARHPNPSVQVNMRAGEFLPAEDDGYAYLNIPLNRL
jgi:hypothetical protein